MALHQNRHPWRNSCIFCDLFHGTATWHPHHRINRLRYQLRRSSTYTSNFSEIHYSDKNIYARVMITLPAQITKELSWLLNYTVDVQNAIVSVERVKEFMEYPQEPKPSSQNQVPDEWPKKGEIVFDDYNLQYREGLDLVLRGLTFSIKSGEKVTFLRWSNGTEYGFGTLKSF